MERIDIDLVADVFDDGGDLAGGVAEDEACAGAERAFAEPADHGFEVLTGFWRVVGFDDHVAAGDVDFVLEGEGDGERCEGFLEIAVGGVDGFDAGLEA